MGTCEVLLPWKRGQLNLFRKDYKTFQSVFSPVFHANSLGAVRRSYLITSAVSSPSHCNPVNANRVSTLTTMIAKSFMAMLLAATSLAVPHHHAEAEKRQESETATATASIDYAKISGLLYVQRSIFVSFFP